MFFCTTPTHNIEQVVNLTTNLVSRADCGGSDAFCVWTWHRGSLYTRQKKIKQLYFRKWTEKRNNYFMLLQTNKCSSSFMFRTQFNWSCVGDVNWALPGLLSLSSFISRPPETPRSFDWSCKLIFSRLLILHTELLTETATNEEKGPWITRTYRIYKQIQVNNYYRVGLFSYLRLLAVLPFADAWAFCLSLMACSVRHCKVIYTNHL